MEAVVNNVVTNNNNDNNNNNNNNNTSKKEMYHSAVKCIYCREPCDANDSSESCRRCTKNELKYGKPSVCHYCQLAAAFVGKLCQLCTYYEKHCGKPVTCRHCKLKAAFVKPQDKIIAVATSTDNNNNNNNSANNNKKAALCRLCKLTYSKSVAAANEKHNNKLLKRKLASDESVSTTTSGTGTPNNTNKKLLQQFNEQDSTSTSSTTRISASSSSINKKYNNSGSYSSSKKVAPIKINASTMTDDSIRQTKEALNEHVLTVTQLKDEAFTLKRQLQIKDQEIFERDKKVADLKAQVKQLEKEQRLKIIDLQKQHQHTVDMMQEKVKNLNKELASSNSNSKKNVAKEKW